MKQVWNIYNNNYHIGYCNKLDEVFKFIETKAGQPLKNWDVTSSQIRVVIDKDVYIARKEDIRE